MVAILLILACGALILAALVIYVLTIRSHVAVAASAMGKADIVAASSGWLARLDAKLLGWKTIILAWVAVTAQALPPILNEALPQVASLPWVQVVDQKVATWITIACTLLIPIVHAKGLATAAKTEPQD